MPAGVSWSRYLTVSASALLAMLLGSQTVHSIYRPMKDFNQLVEEEKTRMRKEAEKINKSKTVNYSTDVVIGSVTGEDGTSEIVNASVATAGSGDKHLNDTSCSLRESCTQKDASGTS